MTKTYTKDDMKQAFVDGARFQKYDNGFTDIREEANRRYDEKKLRAVRLWNGVTYRYNPDLRYFELLNNDTTWLRAQYPNQRLYDIQLDDSKVFLDLMEHPYETV
jgi:hypothetical protein